MSRSSVAFFSAFILASFFATVRPALAQEDAADPAVRSADLLGEIQDVLREASTPLTEEQSAALGPILEASLREAPQRGAVIEQLQGRVGELLTEEQASALRRAEAGRLLLEEGVAGLRATLQAAGAPALTFDQETQVRSVYDAHVRALEDMLAASGGDRTAIEPEIRLLQDQLLLAAIKFLNPAQRTALTGSLSAADFAELNSDLPEDENELREYLSDLRSPAGAGGSGGGFRGGGRDDNLTINGFSGGRMPNRDEIQEIRINENSFTAENSDQERGQTEIITRGGTGRFNGDATFDFADESLDARNAFAASRPPYQRRDFSANLSGPVLRNRLTLTFGMERNKSEEGDNLQALTPGGLRNDAITRPQESYDYTTRATAQLSQNHVLNTSLSFGGWRSENNNVGGFGLPEQGTISDRRDFSVQVKETAILSRRFNNEVRFRYARDENDNIPLTTGPHIDVTGAFRTGGATSDSENTRSTWEFGNLLMYTGNRLALRMGFDGWYIRDHWIYSNNFNGTFTFDTLEDYIAGRPSQFEYTEGNPVVGANQFEFAAYLQSDWRVRSNLTLSFGARYETQTNLDDHNNIDPRFGFAYSLGPSTVLRGGTGIFHDRFGVGTLIGAIRVNGELQRNIEIQNPGYPDPFAGGEVVIPPPSIRRLAEDLAAPYTWNSEVSLEHSFADGLVLTGSYRFIRGVHLYRARNVNAPYDATSPVIRSCQPGQDEVTCVVPDPDFGIIARLESSGTSINHNLRFGFRKRLSFLNINGNYSFNTEYDDVAGNNFTLPADNYDLDSEWGRSGRRHSFNTTFNVRLPWNINADTRLDWQSGEPYTLRTGRDDNQDRSNNDRPAGVPRNSLTGPSFFEVDLNLSKSVQLRSDTVDIGENGAAVGPVAGGGYYGQRTGLRMTITADIQNLFNKVNFNSYNGIQTSRFFGLPTSSRDGRRVSLSVRFNF